MPNAVSSGHPSNAISLSSSIDDSRNKSAIIHSCQDSLLVRALKRQKVPRTPIWIMRQAGRYLPEYRAVRQNAGSFLNLCQNPERACEVALQPLKRFDLDAVILFSDILTIPDALGLGLFFLEGEGPAFQRPIQTIEAIEKLGPLDMSKLSYVTDAVSLIRQEMPSHLPLIGFSGSPWTLACYMVEGQGSRDFKKAMHLLYQEPHEMHQLLNKLTESVCNYLLAQIKSGANVLMLFDTWGGLLSTQDYSTFSLNYMARIVQALKNVHPEIPLILFTKGGGQWLERIADTGCDAIGLDWMTDLQEAKQRVGHRVALQGNLDPAVLSTKPDCVRQHVEKVLAAFGTGEGHVFNLGHGITPDISPDNVSAMIEAVHEYSFQYHLKDRAP